MHLAVDVARSAAGKKFVQYIDDLERGGYIMAGLKPVVDQVRDRGNKANHELPASTKQDSMTTLTITEHLLTGIYSVVFPRPGVSRPQAVHCGGGWPGGFGWRGTTSTLTCGQLAAGLLETVLAPEVLFIGAGVWVGVVGLGISSFVCRSRR
jgi:hypothetical protein